MHLKHHFAICLATAFLFIGHSQVKAQNIAETSIEESSVFYRAMEIVHHQQQLNTQQRPTELKGRIIGISNGDTTKPFYHYSYLPGTTRGSEPDFYAKFFSFQFGLAPEVHFKNPRGVIPFFPRNQIRADTTFQDNGNGGKRLTSVGYYNKNDNLDSIYAYYSHKDELRDKYYLEYGDFGEIKKHYRLLTDTSFTAYNLYEYDSRQRLITDTLFNDYPILPSSGRINVARSYTYNSKDQIETVMEYKGVRRDFSLSSQLFLEYNNDNQLVKITEYSMPSMDTIYHDFTYRKPGDVVYQTYNQLIVSPNTVRKHNTFRYYHFGSNDLPDSFYSWTAYVSPYEYFDTTNVIWLFKYDKKNNLTHFYQTLSLKNSPALMHRVWYEDYNAVGISEKPVQSSAIRIAPNPFHNYLDIFSEKDDAETRIELIDISGRKIFQDKVHLKSGRNHISIPDNISNGIYFLRIEQQNKTLFSGQVLKE